jgi:hypothetical protein
MKTIDSRFLQPHVFKSRKGDCDANVIVGDSLTIPGTGRIQVTDSNAIMTGDKKEEYAGVILGRKTQSSIRS